MELSNKTIFIISRESWGKMFFSKHHYAIELAKRGNKVFFITLPDQQRKLKRGEIRIEESGFGNLWVVNHRLFHPYFFIFKYNRLYNFLTKFHIKRIINRIQSKPEIVWSFEISNSLPLKYFPKDAFKIFMPVDGPYGGVEVKAAKNADVIFSVTNEILAGYNDLEIPKYFINHGVSEIFINEHFRRKAQTPLKVGYSGCFLAQDIDRKNLVEIIEKNQDIEFNLWGEYDYKTSDIHLPGDCSDPDTNEFIKTLQNSSNVKMHGVVNPEQLAAGLKKMDAFLVCYEIKKNQSRGTNSHKLLEYLGSGKVVISSNMITYSTNYPGLLEMSTSRENNDEVPKIFSSVIHKLEVYNSEDRQGNRINFAKKFTYPNQIKKIEGILTSIRNQSSQKGDHKNHISSRQ